MQSRCRTGVIEPAQVCAGVQAMHELEPPLAHRDIKPHNVLLEPRRSARGATGPTISSRLRIRTVDCFCLCIHNSETAQCQ